MKTSTFLIFLLSVGIAAAEISHLDDEFMNAHYDGNSCHYGVDKLDVQCDMNKITLTEVDDGKYNSK